MKLIPTVLASLCLYAVVPRLVARAADESQGPDRGVAAPATAEKGL